MDMHLAVFIEVVERRNFTRAAEALHMTQPAVSQYITALETEYGIKLLERTNKSVQVNKAGKIVYLYAKKILKQYEHLELHLSELKNKPSGELMIGASYTIGEYILPQILVQLQNTYPEILPQVVIGNTEEIGKKLLNHKIDIGLIEGAYPHDQLITETFAVDELYIVAGIGGSLNNKEITDKELRDKTWIIREVGSGTRVITENFLEKRKIKPKQILTFGSTQIIKEAVEANIGISLLSKATIQKELQLGDMQELKVESTPIRRNFSLVKMKQDFYPKVLTVFETLVKNN